jgi:hypothetical protein
LRAMWPFASGTVAELVFLARDGVIEFVLLEHDLPDDAHVGYCLRLTVLIGLPMVLPKVLVWSENGVSLMKDCAQRGHAARDPIRRV